MRKEEDQREPWNACDKELGERNQPTEGRGSRGGEFTRQVKITPKCEDARMKPIVLYATQNLKRKKKWKVCKKWAAPRGTSGFQPYPISGVSPWVSQPFLSTFVTFLICKMGLPKPDSLK